MKVKSNEFSRQIIYLHKRGYSYEKIKKTLRMTNSKGIVPSIQVIIFLFNFIGLFQNI